jgi:hypothetical protein
MEWSWVWDVSDFTYSKHEGVSDFFRKWGGSRFRGVYSFIPNIGGISGIVGWPSTNTNTFLIAHRDLEFGVSNECVKGLIPPDKEPGIVDEFKGEVSL